MGMYFKTGGSSDREEYKLDHMEFIHMSSLNRDLQLVTTRGPNFELRSVIGISISHLF